MKRMIAILLTVLLLGALTACDQNVGRHADGIIKSDNATIEIGKTHTTFDGMNVQIVNVIWNDEEIKFEVKWNNETSYDVVYGEYYKIEKETNGEWENCVTLDNLAFTEIGYELSSKSSQKQTYNLTDMFDISENGKYRLITDCLVYENGHGAESTECEMWVEFTVDRIGDTRMDVKKSFIDFDTQYIRTHWSDYDVDYPIVEIIRSVDELNAYYNENKDKYSLGRREKVYSDETIGFLDACDKYDAKYFDEQILVLVLLREGSGSIRHNVKNVKFGSDGKLYVSIERNVPETGTDDMAGWHIFIEPEKDITVANESDVVVYLDGVNPKTQPTTVYESGQYSNISLTVPYDWKYEIEKGNSDGEYCIAIWPEGQSEGKIKVWYYNAFGVCGTGLEQEEITVGGYSAWKGTYDNKAYWDYISLRNTPGSYVIMNEGADKWLGGYETKLMQIFDTIKVAEGYIFEDEAIDIAKKAVDVKYDEVRTRFDSTDGLWWISFHKKNSSESVKDIVMTLEGKLLDEGHFKLKEVP